MVELIELFILLKKKKKVLKRYRLTVSALGCVVDRINSLIASAEADGNVGKKCKYPINV